MFRSWMQHIPAEEFLVKFQNSTQCGEADPYMAEKPISIFIDVIPEPRQLELNPYNILLLHTPDSISRMKMWTLENGHKFSCILTKDKDILEKYDTALDFSADDIDTLAKETKNFLYHIIQENGIQESTFWSQEGEDRWIAENLVLPDKGTFLEIGGCYPKILSNTYYFEKTLGWQGLVIEPDPIYFSWIQSVRKCRLEQVAISPSKEPMWFIPKSNLVEEKKPGSIQVQCARLDDLLFKHSFSQVDLISIDIEGYEEQAWSTFDCKKYNPQVIITEHTEFGRYDASFTEKLLKSIPNFYIAHTTPLNFILVNNNVKRK